MRLYRALFSEINLPYWRLSGVYFFNCLILGLVLPFWGLYLSSIGHSSKEIGMSNALMLSSTILAPFFWVKFASIFKNSLHMIRMAILCAAILSFYLFKINNFIGTSIFIFIFSFCWQGINPLIESLTLSHLGALSRYYGQIRLWGSIGFIASVSSLGLLFDAISINSFPAILSLFTLLMAISVLFLPNKTYKSSSKKSVGLTTVWKKSSSLGLFIAVFFFQISQGANISFFSLYLQENGISLSLIGHLWSVAVIAEVAMFIVVHRLISKLSAERLLLLSMFITCLRWLMVAFYVELLPIIIVAQLLHAFTYSAAHSSIMELIRQQFGEDNQDRGILIYNTVCLGAGTAIGASLSGMLWVLGSSETFAISAIIAALSTLLVSVWIKNKQTTVSIAEK